MRRVPCPKAPRSVYPSTGRKGEEQGRSKKKSGDRFDGLQVHDLVALLYHASWFSLAHFEK